MIDFEFCIKIVLEKEGGYVNDPDDKGGETKFGISKRAFPNLDIANLTIEQAKAIYKKHYWDAINAESIKEELRLTAFDMAVNAGISTAKMILKMANNLSEYTAKRIDHYKYLTKVRPKSIKYLNGWITRARSIELITKKALQK